ncbi:MAG: triple tyrosine motif-containing protein, partial [bacterium]
GLHDDYLSQIVPDGRGRLWFAGNQGIFSVREKELDELAAGRAARVHPVAYGQQDGLPRLQASHGFWPGALCDKGGALWFAMESGMAVVNAGDFKENREPPPVVIERMTVNGKTVAAYGAGEPLTSPDAAAPVELRQSGARVRLPPGQRQVEFVFTALSFKMPESLGFRYRLHGLDKEWVEAGTRRTASYPHLPPGDYRFQVTACNSDGVWNETGAALELTAEPYWWETAWVRVAGPLAAVGVLGSGVFVWLRRRRRFQIERLELLQATEKERVRIAQDLHDDLGAGLTEIGLLGDLVGAQAANQPETAGLISQRARELAGALDEIVWAVNPRHDNSQALTAYFCRFAQDFLRPAGLACRFDVAESLPDCGLTTETRHQLFLAFKEALNNIVRHARASEVSLRIVSEKGLLVISVTDNGCGFTGAVPTGSPDGLQGMRDRLARLGGECSVHSSAGKGVSVTLSLPVKGGST